MKVMAGIDVGKRSLDVSVAAGPARRFDNTPAGLTALVEWLERQGTTEVVCEPTGGYERPLVRRVQATGWPIHVVQQRQGGDLAGRAGSVGQHLAALAAIRCNDDLKRFYQRLCTRGKTGKVALVAVMRKLLLVLNAIAQRGSPWVQHPAPAGHKKALTRNTDTPAQERHPVPRHGAATHESTMTKQPVVCT